MDLSPPNNTLFNKTNNIVYPNTNVTHQWNMVLDPLLGWLEERNFNLIIFRAAPK
jgi:hypothetical protein